jgi:formamidopyrimidine-DNA glycosylase
MPELPEVETIVRGLASHLPGLTVQTIAFHDCKLEAASQQAARLLPGQRVSAVTRFGKYILFSFEDASSLVAHLRMTGKFVYAQGSGAHTERHIRMSISFTDGSCLFFTDVRRFGTLRFVSAGSEISERARIGPDPLESRMNGQVFASILAGRRAPIKRVLLDQQRISGIGNIYACEALFRAGVDPRRPASELEPREVARLYRELRTILREAIRHNGTTINDFRNVDDKTGDFQHWLRVYDREGEPCRKCGHPIFRIRQDQRSTYYCPQCQKL